LGGGGLGFMSNSNPTISFCSITDNNAIHSAGIYFHYRTEAIVSNCTISNNTADSYGGGIRLAAECRVTLINSILWDNTPQEASVISNDILTVFYSDINGGQDGIQLGEEAQLNWGDGNIDEDPLFVDPDEGDYHLTEDSPCIDAGDPDSPEDPDGTRADMGAYFFLQAGLLEGLVLDATDDSPLENAMVMTSYGRSALTDEDGFWRIDPARRGDFDITASMQDFFDSFDTRD